MHSCFVEYCSCSLFFILHPSQSLHAMASWKTHQIFVFEKNENKLIIIGGEIQSVFCSLNEVAFKEHSDNI